MDYLRYESGNTILHRLDPRTKFVFFLVMAVLTSVTKSGAALLFLFGCFLVLWKTCGIDKSMRILFHKLQVLLAFILLLWLVMGLFSKPPLPGPVFFSGAVSLFGINGTLCFDWYDLYKGFVYALRIYLMIASFYTVLITTNFSDMIIGLRKWHIPYSVAYGIGLVFQVIPMVIGELQSIMEAQSARGLEIEKCGWIRKIRNYVTFSMPLLFRTISKGQSISLAMQYYRLDFSRKRTSYREMCPSVYDLWFTVSFVTATVLTLILELRYYIAV